SPWVLRFSRLSDPGLRALLAVFVPAFRLRAPCWPRSGPKLPSFFGDRRARKGNCPREVQVEVRRRRRCVRRPTFPPESTRRPSCPVRNSKFHGQTNRKTPSSKPEGRNVPSPMPCTCPRESNFARGNTRGGGLLRALFRSTHPAFPV